MWIEEKKKKTNFILNEHKKALTQNESNYKTKAILSNALILFGNIAPLPVLIGVSSMVHMHSHLFD